MPLAYNDSRRTSLDPESWSGHAAAVIVHKHKSINMSCCVADGAGGGGSGLVGKR